MLEASTCFHCATKAYDQRHNFTFWILECYNLNNNQSGLADVSNGVTQNDCGTKQGEIWKELVLDYLSNVLDNKPKVLGEW
jgi:hypothetical protein